MQMDLARNMYVVFNDFRLSYCVYLTGSYDAFSSGIHSELGTVSHFILQGKFVLFQMNMLIALPSPAVFGYDSCVVWFIS